MGSSSYFTSCSSFLEEQIGESDIKNDGMWDSDSVTEDEEIAFEKGEIKLFQNKTNENDTGYVKPKFGEFTIFADHLCKYTSFETVINNSEVGVYIIACTEY